MEDNVSLCTNCQRQIAASNFVTHSLHCQRNLTKCDKCGEAVPRSGLEEHHAEYHAMVPCPDCNVSFEQPQLQKHRETTCRSRKVSCQFCELEMPANEMNDHVNYCGSRTKRCEECGEYVMLKYEQLHLDSNHGFLKLDDEPGPTATWIKNELDITHGDRGKSNNNAKKPHLNRVKFENDSDEDVDEIDRMLAGLMKKGQKKKPPPPRHPGVAYPVMNAGFQRSFGRSPPSSSSYLDSTPSDAVADDLVALPCEFCEAMIPSNQLFLHQTGCRPDIASLGPSFAQNKPTKNVNFLPKRPEVIDIGSDSFIDVVGDSDSDNEVLMVDQYNSHGISRPTRDVEKWSRKSNIDKEVDSDVILPCEFCGDGYPPDLLLDHQDLCKIQQRTWRDPSPVRSAIKDVSSLPRPNNIAEIAPQRKNEDHMEHIDLTKRVSERLVTVDDDDDEDHNSFQSRHNAGGGAESNEHIRPKSFVFPGISSIAPSTQITSKEIVPAQKSSSEASIPGDILSQPDEPNFTLPSDFIMRSENHTPLSLSYTTSINQSKTNYSPSETSIQARQRQLPHSINHPPHEKKIELLKKTYSSSAHALIQPKQGFSVTSNEAQQSAAHKASRTLQYMKKPPQDPIGYSSKLSMQPVFNESRRVYTPSFSSENSPSCVPSNSSVRLLKLPNQPPLFPLPPSVTNQSAKRCSVVLPSDLSSFKPNSFSSLQEQKLPGTSHFHLLPQHATKEPGRKDSRMVSDRPVVCVLSCPSLHHNKSSCFSFWGTVANLVPSKSAKTSTQIVSRRSPGHLCTQTQKLCKSSLQGPPTQPVFRRSPGTDSFTPSQVTKSTQYDYPHHPIHAPGSQIKLPSGHSLKGDIRKPSSVLPQSTYQHEVSCSPLHTLRTLKAAGPQTKISQGTSGGSSVLNPFRNNLELSKEWNDLDSLRPTAATGAIPKQKAGKPNIARQVTQEAQGSRTTSNSVTANQSLNSAKSHSRRPSSRLRKNAERSPLNNFHNRDAL